MIRKPMLQRIHAALIHLLVYALAAGSLWAQGISSSGVVAPCSPPAELDNPYSLYFPFFQTDHGSFSGYAASNFSDSMALLDFGAFDGDGQLLPFARNPSRFELAPQNQLAQQGIEIFQAEDEAHSGWVRMVADNSSIGSFFQFGSSNLSWLDGGVAVSEPSRKFYFTRVLNGPEALWGHAAETFLSLANPTPEPIELQLTYRPNRAPGAAPFGLQGAAVVKNLELPACGFVYRSVPEIYGENLSGGYLEVEVIQGAAAVGFALIDFKERSTVIGLNASPGNPFKEAFSAQLAIVPSEVSTSFKVINVSSGERTVQFSAIGPDGEALVEPFQIVFQPGQALEQDAAALLGIAGPVEGSLHLTASGDGIIGDVVFGNSADLSYAAALLLQDRRFLEAVFSQVANLEGFFTGLALYFPSPGTAQVTIEVVSAAGVKTGETTLQLEAGVRLSELLVDLIASTAGQVGGLILIRSDKGLVAQELFGTSGLSLLSAVPPTLSRVAPELIESPYARWENGPSTDPDYFPSQSRDSGVDSVRRAGQRPAGRAGRFWPLYPTDGAGGALQPVAVARLHAAGFPQFWAGCGLYQLGGAWFLYRRRDLLPQSIQGRRHCFLRHLSGDQLPCHRSWKPGVRSRGCGQSGGVVRGREDCLELH